MSGDYPVMKGRHAEMDFWSYLHVFYNCHPCPCTWKPWKKNPQVVSFFCPSSLVWFGVIARKPLLLLPLYTFPLLTSTWSEITKQVFLLIFSPRSPAAGYEIDSVAEEHNITQQPPAKCKSSRQSMVSPGFQAEYLSCRHYSQVLLSREHIYPHNNLDSFSAHTVFYLHIHYQSHHTVNPLHLPTHAGSSRCSSYRYPSFLTSTF